MALDPVTQSLLQLRGDRVERMKRYQLNWLYYRAHEYLDEPGRDYIREQNLFKYLRRVFGYVTQCVDTDTRFGMGKELQVDAEEAFKHDILEMWERSRFQRAKYKLARYAANLGDAFLILQDIGDGGVVVPRIIVANSEDMDIERDPDDQMVVLRAVQSYSFIGDDGRPHTRDWIYYPNHVERYTDDKMDEGYPRPHPFGAVPVVHIPFIDIGEAYGLNSWHNVQGQLDRVNELGSFSDRILLRYADPMLIGSGVQPDESPTIRRGMKDGNIMFLANSEARLSYLEYQGNVLPEIIELIREIGNNIKDQLPELSLAQIRSQAGLSGYAVSLHAAELIAKINEFRGNVGDGIEWANRMALRAIRRSSLPLEEFDNRIVFEPVLPEDPEQRIRVEEGEQNLGIVSRRELLRRRGLADKEIDDMLREVDDDRNAQGFGLERLGALIDGAGGFGVEGDDPGAGDD